MLQVVRANATGRDVEFQYWNSRVPLLELVSSTAGTQEFHCWNSLSSLVREIISLYRLIELGSIFVAVLLEEGGHAPLVGRRQGPLAVVIAVIGGVAAEIAFQLGQHCFEVPLADMGEGALKPVGQHNGIRVHKGAAFVALAGGRHHHDMALHCRGAQLGHAMAKAGGGQGTIGLQANAPVTRGVGVRKFFHKVGEKNYLTMFVMVGDV